MGFAVLNPSYELLDKPAGISQAVVSDVVRMKIPIALDAFFIELIGRENSGFRQCGGDLLKDIVACWRLEDACPLSVFGATGGVIACNRSF
jgi:hypothetical protein